LAELLADQKAVADLQAVFLATGPRRNRLDFLRSLSGLQFANRLQIDLGLILTHILSLLLHHNYL
jgi:hypothetical protein